VRIAKGSVIKGYTFERIARKDFQSMTTPALPAFYISHGGGPWPWMKGPRYDAHRKLKAALQQLPQLVGVTPKAVLMISAHWEEEDFTVMSHPSPPMIYDYAGFPENTYQIQYAAPGAPRLAERVLGLLQSAGIAVRLDPARGFDHGAFVPMAVIYPDASIPVVQLSLKRGLDPQDHLAAGRALATLRNEGVLIIGSGSSYHNLRMLGPESKEPSAAFDDWLQRTLEGRNFEERADALTSWEAAPSARVAHPREEHLLPLMVAVGAAERDAATRFYHENTFFGSGSVSSFMFTKSS
jgi:aromatic ring-opening dioxygenase catalytic subunit (LigB family)